MDPYINLRYVILVIVSSEFILKNTYLATICIF